MLSPGDKFDERYVVLEVIGSGGMSHVYRAQDEALDRVVALKILRSGITGTSDVQRLQQEARILCAMEHPHIVRCHRISEYEGQVYLDLEYLTGEPLIGTIARNERLPIAVTAKIIRQACEALQYAHSKGVIHRDITPKNILVHPELLSFTGEDLNYRTPENISENTSSLSIKIIDFGLSKLTTITEQKLTSSGEILGSIFYMSPEQIKGRDADERSDVFALTAVLYHCLSGEAPLVGCMPFGMAAAEDDIGVPSIGDIPSFDKVFQKGMAPNPKDRYSDTKQLMDAVLDAAAQPAKLQKAQALHDKSQNAPRAASRKMNSTRLAVAATLGFIAISGTVLLFLFYTLSTEKITPAVIGCAATCDRIGMRSAANFVLTELEHKASKAGVTISPDLLLRHAILKNKMGRKDEAAYIAAEALHTLAQTETEPTSHTEPVPLGDLIVTCEILRESKPSFPTAPDDCLTLIKIEPTCGEQLLETAIELGEERYSLQPVQLFDFYRRALFAVRNQSLVSKRELNRKFLAQAQKAGGLDDIAGAIRQCISAGEVRPVQQLIDKLEQKKTSLSRFDACVLASSQTQLAESLGQYPLTEQYARTTLSLLSQMPEVDNKKWLKRDTQTSLITALAKQEKFSEFNELFEKLSADSGSELSWYLLTLIEKYQELKRFDEAKTAIKRLEALAPLTPTLTRQLRYTKLVLACDMKDLKLVNELVNEDMATAKTPEEKISVLNEAVKAYLDIRNFKTMRYFVDEIDKARRKYPELYDEKDCDWNVLPAKFYLGQLPPDYQQRLIRLENKCRATGDPHGLGDAISIRASCLYRMGSKKQAKALLIAGIKEVESEQRGNREAKEHRLKDMRGILKSWSAD